MASSSLGDIELRDENDGAILGSDDTPSNTADIIDDPSAEEMQCEEVDMDDDLMDPMEWTVRKFLPIPKVYFWDTGNGDKLSFRTRMWHRTVAVMGKTLRAAEFCGEVIANVFGINSSRYQYVMDGMSEEDWKKAQELNDKRNKEWEDYYAQKEVAEDVGVDPNAL